MDTLKALFGSEVKVKLLRLFAFNPQTPFLLKELITRTLASTGAIKRELKALAAAGLIKKRLVSKEVRFRKNEKESVRKMKGAGYSLNEHFPYIDPLKNLLSVTSLQADESLAKRFTNAGKIKMLVASGVFIQNWDSRVDLLIVGDELNLHKIEAVIKVIESEIGKEIAYSAFETLDFEYRYGIHDRLVRDILDYPHVTLLDRLAIEPQ